MRERFGRNMKICESQFLIIIIFRFIQEMERVEMEVEGEMMAAGNGEVQMELKMEYSFHSLYRCFGLSGFWLHSKQTTIPFFADHLQFYEF